jgi:hypothetical protein
MRLAAHHARRTPIAQLLAPSLRSVHLYGCSCSFLRRLALLGAPSKETFLLKEDPRTLVCFRSSPVLLFGIGDRKRNNKDDLVNSGNDADSGRFCYVQLVASSCPHL